MYSITIFITILVFFEIAFRIYYYSKYGRPYHVSIRFPWKRNHVITHPFLSFAYKPNEIIDINQPLPYELHPNEYYSFKEPLRINNLGHFGKDFELCKKQDVLRIACLGNSSTANNIADTTSDYSYPTILQEYLQQKIKNQKVEVYNCGIGGWVSADILIDFELNILPTQPDYVIFCHAFTDLHLYLTDDFALDYSHCRRNLGEEITKIKIASYLPKLRFWHLYEWLKDSIFGTGNVRNECWRAVRKKNPDITRNYRELEVEKNIIKNIFILCKYYKIKCIILSYPFFKYKSDPVTQKMAEGVAIENNNCKKLAEEFAFPFIDQKDLIPQDKEYFLDWVHLTPKGMSLMAENAGKAIISDILTN